MPANPIETVCFISLMFAISVSGAEETTAVSVCDLLANPVRWEGKIIEVRAPIEAVQDYWVTGEACSARIVVKGTTFFAGFVLRDNTSKSLTRKQVDFRWDSASVEQLNAALLEAETTKSHVRATVVGMFETVVPLDRLIDEHAPFKFRGFGHMGGAPGQILVKTVKDIRIEK